MIFGVWGRRREPKGPLTQKQGLISAVVCPYLALDHHCLLLYLLKSTSKCFPARDFSPSVCVPICLLWICCASSWSGAASLGAQTGRCPQLGRWISLTAGWMHLVCDPGLPGMLCCPAQAQRRAGQGWGGCLCFGNALGVCQWPALPDIFVCALCLLAIIFQPHYQLDLGTESGSSPVFPKLSGSAWYTLSLYIWNFQFHVPPTEWPAVLTSLSRSDA